MKKLKTTILLGIIISALTIPALAQNSIDVPLSNPGEPGKLVISAMFSDEIEVRTHNQNNVIVNYNGEEQHEDDSEAMKDGLRRISGGGLGLEVTEEDNEVHITTGPMPNGDLEMLVLVPRNFGLKLNTVQGDVKVSGLRGEMEISAVNGDIEVSDVAGTVLVNSVNGDMNIDFTAINQENPMSFTGVNGDMEVSFPEDAAFTAKMKTEWGDVYTNFDMDIDRSSSKSESDDDNEFKIAINKWIIGQVNGGGPEFLFKTLHGDISIRKKEN
ncbi:DUF4097 family beta strand repeat-containing protein [Gracilimonas sp.]|uniref:DUF4097 family beta strand repeat-containing protein n=1 Tax=Gracilimonas sp. TaxID=1974203 RepID=UPI0028726167|nr:DUF4097 family beta strand repeat-containing protein [Gracilimonas sp.]